MWKHIYFINIFVLFICIFTRVTVHFLVANDKNRNQTTLRKIVGFICSLTGKFKDGTGLTPMYTTRLSLLSLHFHALFVTVSLFILPLFSHAIHKVSSHNKKDAHGPINPIPYSYQFWRERAKSPSFHVLNLMEWNLLTWIWSKQLLLPVNFRIHENKTYQLHCSRYVKIIM